MTTAKTPAFGELDDLTEFVDYALVGPIDNRVHELRTTRFPYNTVCHLGRDFGDGTWRGCSGVLIAPRVVLTAGHCLYSLKFGKPPTRIRVSPGRRDRRTFPYGSIISKRYFVHPRFVKAASSSDRPNFDYGLIVLPRPFPGILRYMPLRAHSDRRLLGRGQAPLVAIAGYPGDRPVGTMWRHAERLKKVSPRRLFYSVDTCPGHSGSPVWMSDPFDKELQIIGVHTSGMLDEKGRSYGCSKQTVLAPPGLMNSGIRITPEVLGNIKGALRKAGDGGSALVSVP